MPSTSPTRRRYLAAAGSVATGTALAGCNGLLGGGSDDPPTIDGLDGAWPQAGYDAANAGHSPDAAGPSGPVRRAWEFETDARSDWTPAVAEGSVYLLDKEGVVYAIDAADGSQRWRQSLDPGDGRPTGTGAAGRAGRRRRTPGGRRAVPPGR